MFELPTTIRLGGKEFPIRNNGDYRMVLDCFAALQDTELDEQARTFTCLIIFYNDINSIEDLTELPDINEAISKMYDFFNCGKPEVGGSLNYSILDWEKDEQLIASAINNVAQTEVRALPYLHWWTFMGYYSAIGESPLATILGIREKIVKGKPLEKYEKEYRRNNPGYFDRDYRSTEQIGLEEEIKNLWNKGN